MSEDKYVVEFIEDNDNSNVILRIEGTCKLPNEALSEIGEIIGKRFGVELVYAEHYLS